MQISLTFVNEFVKWPRPLNLIGRLKLGHPGWQLFKLVAKRQQEKQMSLCKDSSVLKRDNVMKALIDEGYTIKTRI